MDLRRKKPTDMTGIKTSRAAHTGIVTRNYERLRAMPFDQPEEVQRIKLTEVKTILKTLLKTEAGFSSSMEEAQEFVPTDEAEESAFQEEELEVEENFSQSLSTARILGEQLLACKSTLSGIATFKNSLDGLQESLDSDPDQDNTTSLKRLQTLILSLQEQWMEADIPPEHPLKTELDACERKLTLMERDVGAARSRSLPAAPPTFSSSFSSAGAPAHHYSELPKIKVPTFSGDILGWSTFWSTFKSTVDDRHDLSDPQKLNYLRQAITDPTLQPMMTSLMEGPDTYKETVAELKDRFQKTKEIHRAITKNILNTSDIKYTRTGLRLVYDLFRANMSNLKSTKFYTLETFFCSMLYNELPAKLQRFWDQATQEENHVPPVDKLLNFVKHHAETLPADDPPAKTEKNQEPASKRPPPKRREYASSQGRNNVHVATVDYKWDCILCAPEKHPLYQCSKWASYSLLQKTAHISTNNLCSNCLSGGHSTASCKSPYRCKECKQKHHTSIHEPQAATPSVNHSSTSSHQVPDALMTTAQLLLIGPNGEELQARALIDSGAGISLVTKRVTQILNLPLEPARLQLSVAQGETTKPLEYLTSLKLAPLHNRSLKMSCHPAVSTAVTSNLPSQPIPSVTHLPHLMGVRLADLTYNIPGQIDILLGADMASSIISPDPPKQGKTTEPVAQSTKFGWTLSGPVPGFNREAETASAYHQLPMIQRKPILTIDPQVDVLLGPILKEQEGPEDNPTTHLDEQVEIHYVSHVSFSASEQASEQRNEVTLSEKACIKDLEESRRQAVTRYVPTEKSNTEEAVLPFQNKDVIQKGYFHPRNWRTSSQDVLYQLPEDLQETNPLKDSTAVNSQSQSKAILFYQSWRNELPILAQKTLPRYYTKQENISPTTLLNHTLWWEWSSWLKTEPIKIPKQPPRKPLLETESTINILKPHFSIAEDISALSKAYPHLVAITAWCRRFYKRIKEGRPSPDNRTKRLTGKERQEAERWLFKEAQRRSFQKDMSLIEKAKPLLRISRLKTLNPFIDDHGLIRLGGRLSNSHLALSQSHPIIMDAKGPLMIKYFEYLHLLFCHYGQFLLRFSASTLHILGARRLCHKDNRLKISSSRFKTSSSRSRPSSSRSRPSSSSRSSSSSRPSSSRSRPSSSRSRPSSSSRPAAAAAEPAAAAAAPPPGICPGRKHRSGFCLNNASNT